MGLDIYFVYETEDKDRLEVRGVACRGLQDLFEYPCDIEQLQNSVLNPPFVRDFPKLKDWKPSEIDFDEITDEEWEKMLEPYVGPTFEAEELIAWTSTWIDIIKDLNEEERRVVLPLATNGYDWTSDLLEDLKEIEEQGRCAQRHDVKMHIEMY